MVDYHDAVALRQRRAVFRIGRVYHDDRAVPARGRPRLDFDLEPLRHHLASGAQPVGGGDTLHDLAIRALSRIPGFEQEKVVDLTALVKAGRNLSSSIHALKAIPIKHWPKNEIRPMVDNLVGYLSEIPAS